MGVVVKQSFYGTVLSYLGVVISYVNALYLRAEYFDLSQIGLFTLVISNAMILSPISSFGMASSFIKYFPVFKKPERNRFFTFLFLVTLAGNAVVLFIIYLLRDLIASRYADTSPQYIDYLLITAIIILTTSLFNLFFSYSRSIMKVVFPSFLTSIYLKISSLLLISGYALEWWDFSASVIGLGIAYAMAFVLLIIKLISFDQFRFDFKFSFLTREWKIKLVKFGSYSMLFAGSYALTNNITYDQITTILGVEISGIFTTCFFIAVIVEMPRGNMAKVVIPIISSEFKNRNMKKVTSLYKRSSITMSVIGCLLFILIASNLQDLFNFIPKGGDFQTGFWVVISVCFAKLLGMSSSFPGEIINLSHLYKYNLLFQAITAFTLTIINYFMITYWGLNGAAIGYITAISLHIFLKVGFVYHKFNIHPLYKKHIPLLLIGLSVGLGAYLFQIDWNPIVAIAIRSILTASVFIFLIYQFQISRDINKIIRFTFGRFLNIKLIK